MRKLLSSAYAGLLTILRRGVKAGLRISEGSAAGDKVDIAVESALWILVRGVHKRISGARWEKDRSFVESKYDAIAGEDVSGANNDLMAHHYMGGRLALVRSKDLHAAMVREYISIFSEHLPHPPKTILEVGGGELTTLVTMMRHFGPDVRYFSLDLSLNRILTGKRFIRKELGERYSLEVCKATAVAIPFPDTSFDLVYTSHMLEHMPYDYEAAIAEICRVSKGQAFLFEPSFELGGPLQKLRITAHDYVRGIPAGIRGIPGASLSRHQLLDNGSIANRGALHLVVTRARRAQSEDRVPFTCLRCKCPLTLRSEQSGGNKHLHCGQCQDAYLIFEGIPLLDPDFCLHLRSKHP